MSTLLIEQINSFPEFGGILLDVEQRVVNADYQPELADAAVQIADYEAGMFAGEFDSNGESWAPLKPSTIKRKGHDRILIESGALRESLVHVGGPGNITEVMPRGMLFGADVEYAIFHQQGTSRMPSRPPVGMSEETLDKLVNSVADGTVERMKLTL